MDELHKCLAEGNLNKAADLMKSRLNLLERQIADASRRPAIVTPYTSGIVSYLDMARIRQNRRE
jgi:hypothetical protein